MNTYRTIKWIGIVLLAISATTLFHDERLFDPFFPISTFVVTVGILLAVFGLNILVLNAIRRRFPTIEQTRQRIIALALASFGLTAVFITTTTLLIDNTAFLGYDLTLKHYTYEFGAAWLSVLMLLSISESYYVFNQWKTTTLESEQLKQEQLQTQLDSLKKQVNPHFLFNSLNSLSSLIEIDETKAQVFIEELAQVYRYLLQTNESELTTLDKELAFIEAYAFLLKTRFSKGFTIQIEVSEDSKTKLIPPLTLQLLVENAVKHNITAASKPLIVRIFDKKQTSPNAQNLKNMEKRHPDLIGTEGGILSLIVANNLQKRQTPVVSNRLGLQNIIKKYQLLGQKDVSIEETATEFKVILPLI